MKNAVKIRLTLCMTVVFCCLYAVPLLAQNPCPQFTGTWEYVLEDAEGMWIGTATHYVAISVSKNRGQMESTPPTEAEQVAAFSSIIFGSGGTWSCEGNVATMMQHYSHNPNAKGTSFKFEFEMEGDTAKYWVLDAEGERGTMGMSRRIKK